MHLDEEMRRITYFPNEQTDHQENYKHHQKEKQQPRLDRATVRALELYNRLKILDAQRETSNKSLMLAAAGVVVLVGGAAASVADTHKSVFNVGVMVAVIGGLTELCGLFAFVKSA